MLTDITKAKTNGSEQPPARNVRRERRLWHDGSRNTGSLGCSRCSEKDICGGLQVARDLFDCLGFCCGNPSDCDSVCRLNPKTFARRVREIGGFPLDSVPRAQLLAAPALPAVVPVFYHGDNRETPFRAPGVCLPLYKVIGRENGEARYATAQELANGFRIAADVSVILSGTAPDKPLERWWSLGTDRRGRIRELRGLGVALVTSPNYSMFTDQPRWDDLHSMKRIAITHEEFLREGLPAALHLNARTERDWERWTIYVAARPEITHVAFEFATGAGWARRTAWHAEQLARLAKGAGRPLHLVMRGGAKVVPTLAAAFSGLTLLETSVFMKTQSRRRAVANGSAVNWQASPTKADEPLDALLMDNWQVIAASHGILTAPRTCASEHIAEPVQAVG